MITALIKTVFGSSNRPPVVDLPQLNRALSRVQNELSRHGFFDERLAEVEVFLVPLALGAYGWQWYGTTGEIDIPAISLAKLHDHLVGTYFSLADVLRHEYGHALADTHRGLFRSRQFRDAFHASHDDARTAFEYDPYFHVSDYAATNASEDFAETFMLYLRHSGRLPPCHATRPKIKKWRFIEELSRAIARSQRRWRKRAPRTRGNLLMSGQSHCHLGQ
jgi:hypothetical protein